MSLFFYDFSLIRFARNLGERLVRRQRVSMEDFDGYDDGDTLRLYSRPGALPSQVTTTLGSRTIVTTGEIVVTSGYATAGDGGGGKFVGIIGDTTEADDLTIFEAANGRFFLVEQTALDVRQAGAQPDTADQTTELTAACAANPGGTVRVPAGTFRTTAVPTRASVRGTGKSTVLAQETTSFPGSSAVFWSLPSDGTDPPIVVTGAITAGQRTFPTTNTRALQVGDQVFLRLGEDPWDPNECLTRSHDIVTAVVPNTSFTVKVGAPESCDAPGGGLPPTTFAHTVLRILDPASLVEIGDFSVGPGAETPFGAVRATYNECSRIKNVWVNESDNGTVIDGCDTTVLDGYYHGRMRDIPHGSPQNGTVISLYGGTNNVVKNVSCYDVLTQAIYTESQVRSTTFENFHCRSGSDATGGGAGEPVIFLSGGCKGLVLKNFTHQHASTRILLQTAADGAVPGDVQEYRTEDWYVDGADCYLMPLENHYGNLRYQGVTWCDRRTTRVTVELLPGTTHVLSLPRGLLCRVRALGTSATGVTSALLTDGGGGSVDVLSAIWGTPGTQTTIGGHIGTASQTNKGMPGVTESHTLTVITDNTVPVASRLFLWVDVLTRPATDDPTFPNDQTVYVRTIRFDGPRWIQGTAAPAAGNWGKGDRVWNSNSTIGQPDYWVCTTAGAPGTWRAGPLL